MEFVEAAEEIEETGFAERIKDLRAATVVLHDADVAENGEVVRDRGHVEPDEGGEIGDAPFARSEGIDELIADRAQQAAIKATDDLLAKAERILRQDGDDADSRLWHAAQSLREPAQEGPEMLPVDFKPLEELIFTFCSMPLPRSLADTDTIPFESISKETSICGIPRGAGGMPTSSKTARDLLSLAKSRSP